MRKLKILLTSIVCLVVALVMPMSASMVNQTAGAEEVKTISVNKTDEQIKDEIITELETFIEYGVEEENKTRSSRIPGSQAEYNAAIYLQNEMLKLDKFEPVNNVSTENGLEKFTIKSVYDNNNYNSQNVVFRRESLAGSNKKVVLACHYDTMYVAKEGGSYASGEGAVTDGVNDNASGVAMLLTLARNLDILELDPGYDIEIVFFGSSSNNYDGASFYLRGMSDEDAKNILLMVNFDRISLGNYNYAYVNEYETSQQKYLLDVLNRDGEFKLIKNENVLDFDMNSPNGLDYTHVGLESDHAKFMARNINVLNFFSGNYENALTFGLSEYENKNSLTFTTNDNYAYIKQNCNNFADNILKIYKGIDSVLWDANFVSEMEKDNGAEEWYKAWTNEKLAVFITAVLLIVFIAVYYMIYHLLLNNSRKKKIENDIDRIVIRITKNIGEDDQTLNNLLDQKIKDDTDQNEE